MPEAPERRGTRRKVVRWPATWWVSDEMGRGARDEGEVHDVSAEGVFLAPYSMVSHSLRPGTRVRLGVSSPKSGEDMEILGKVRWIGLHKIHRCGGVGIEFEAPVGELTSARI